MTNEVYIAICLKRFNVTDDEIELLMAKAGVIPNGIIEPGDTGKVDRAMYDFIPIMLAGLSNVSEGGYSISWNVEAIKMYYKVLANQLGLPNALTPKPKIRNASNRW